MTNADAIKWLENLKKDIGNPAHQSLWHYEQVFTEIIDLLADRRAEQTKPQTDEKAELNAYRGCVKSRSFWDAKHCDGCIFYDDCPFNPREDEDEPQKRSEIK